MDITLWIELALFAILMGFSAFFSSSETSLFSLSKLQIEQMRRDDNPRVGLIERLLSEPRRLIVTILIGNEFVNVAGSVISAAIVIELLGAENKLINLFIMIPILLLVGEITPKTLAIKHNAAFATMQSRPIDLFATGITPIRWVVRLVAEWFTTLVVGKERTRGSIVTKDMVRTLAREAVGEGVLDRDEAKYIDQIFDFGNKTLESIMTPRSQIFFLPIDTSPSEMVSLLRRSRHTKVPVYREHRDEIVGILYSRDLLGVDIDVLDEDPTRLQALLREPYFVPETKPAADLFHVFRTRKQSLALTVDEYGGVTGLVSMEDLLETIFGDIPSPSDSVQGSEFAKLPDGSSRVDGGMTLESFDSEFETELAQSDADTVAGLILHSYGELPPEGTDLALDGLVFTVTRIENNRVKEAMVRRKREPVANEPETEEPAATEPEARESATEEPGKPSTQPVKAARAPEDNQSTSD